MTYHQKPTVLIARSGYGSPQPGLAPMAGVLDFLKGAGKGVLDFFGQTQQQKGQVDLLKAQQEAAAARGGLPSWFLPVALVGGGVVLVMLLKRPRQNPSRGHRRRRRARRRHRRNR